MPSSSKERLRTRKEFLGAAAGGLIAAIPFLKLLSEGELLVAAKTPEVLQKPPQVPPLSEPEVIKPPEKIPAVPLQKKEAVLPQKAADLPPEPQEKTTEVKVIVNTLEKAPFFSQFNPEFSQDIRKMGCGPISLAMELAYRKKVNPDLESARNVVKRARCLGLWSRDGTNCGFMAKLAKTYGIAADAKTLNNLDELKQVLETTQNPLIAGYHVDGNLTKIGHLILVLAVDQEKGLVYTHDSATEPFENGDNRVYDIPTFEKAWNSQGRWVVSFGEEIETVDEEGFPVYLLPSVLEWKDKIKEWSQGYSLDIKTIAILMQLESAGNPKAVSRSGAQGLFQVMPDKFTAGEKGKHFDPDINAKRGLGYFIACQERATALGYEGIDNLVQAAQGYNGGINIVGKDISGEANLFQKRFHGFYTEDHPVIDEFYYHYSTHLG